LSALLPNREQDSDDPLEVLEIEDESSNGETPAKKVERMQLVDIIENELKKLPLRQREAFLLRYWEELDVSETAAAMKCSEGSVKTHCSRATHALAKALKERGISL
jgi:RNA polymerase sigma-70 factor (ECF subfamily)